MFMICPVDLELVVAHFAESLRWLNRVPKNFQKTVYAKGSFPGADAIALPNSGREAHSYLHHMVHRYDSLSPLTVFCQGHPFDHASDFHQTLKNLASGSLHVSDFQWLGFIIDTDDSRGKRLFVNWSKNPGQCELELDRLYETLFEEPCPPFFTFYIGAQFIVRRETILSRPREFYEKALALSLEIENSAHGFERIWDRIFGVQGVDPEILAGKTCAYLKPIKRLLKTGPETEKKSRY